METRYIEISLETAKRWYEQGGELKDMALGAYTLEEMGYKLPTTWEDYIEKCKKWHIIVGTEDYEDKNPQIAAVKKLILLRDFYNNNWKPDWDNIIEYKYGITYWYNRDTRESSYAAKVIYCPPCFLVFNDMAKAEEFLNNFRELIEQAGDLIYYDYVNTKQFRFNLLLHFICNWSSDYACGVSYCIYGQRL